MGHWSDFFFRGTILTGFHRWKLRTVPSGELVHLRIQHFPQNRVLFPKDPCSWYIYLHEYCKNQPSIVMVLLPTWILYKSTMHGHGIFTYTNTVKNQPSMDMVLLPYMNTVKINHAWTWYSYLHEYRKNPPSMVMLFLPTWVPSKFNHPWSWFLYLGEYCKKSTIHGHGILTYMKTVKTNHSCISP